VRGILHSQAFSTENGMMSPHTNCMRTRARLLVTVDCLHHTIAIGSYILSWLKANRACMLILPVLFVRGCTLALPVLAVPRPKTPWEKKRAVEMGNCRAGSVSRWALPLGKDLALGITVQVSSKLSL
jgi:hypothetical protein